MQLKWDLRAAGNVKEKHPEWALWDPQPGHRPGVPAGLRVDGRGALTALGIHEVYFQGIAR